MSKINCALCGQEKSRDVCEVLTLTETEKAAIENAPDEYCYCRPCWKVLNDPVNGPALMKGIIQTKLRSIGVPGDRAAASAQEFQRKLSALSTRSTRRPS